MTSPHDGLLARVEALWSASADTFDDEPDHGLRDPVVRRAWRRRLRAWLPEIPADVVDLGCGTGSLSVLAAAGGHRVTGIDLSPAMVDRARDKAAALGLDVTFAVGDAGAPAMPSCSVDVVLVRHVTWTLPAPHDAVRRWVELLRPGGRLVLVEGRWHAPDEDGAPAPEEGLPWSGGVAADTLRDALAPLVDTTVVHDLAGDAALWGRDVADERYALVADVAPRQYS